MVVGGREWLCEARMDGTRRHRRLWDQGLQSASDDPLDWAADYPGVTEQEEEATELSNESE